MGRRVKDFIEISDYTSLDSLINTLVAIRDNLPEEAEPELKMMGDDVFGRRLSISYLRELTQEESDCDARYTGGVVEPDPNLDDLRQRLDKIPYRDEDVRRVA
ncbi:MAG TPA: hypothetical protein VFL74_07955 [Sphingomicrobium sp.]|jgi:hypothetical protein|nr:hypothetical protein [Sphingomicrobium sp.]